MERRQFIRGLCGGIAAWPLAAYAQQVSEPRRIGVLGADATVWRQWTAAFVARLRELGWIAGDNLAIEYRWSEGRSQRVSDIAAEFMRQDVDVIVTYGSAVTILKQATTTIPIVFAVAFDPVRSGLVHSLAKPGRQRHGHVDPTARPCQQATRNLARGYAGASPISDSS